MTRLLCHDFLRPIAILVLSTSLMAADATPGSVKIDFTRDVRPILSDKCFACHGPDANERKAGLRLDDVASAFKPTESRVVPIVPHKPDDSELIRRVFSSDEDVVMPPPSFGKKLTEAERRMLRQWIIEGASFQQHWSFVPPRRPQLPAVKNNAWPRNPIDRFILARLEHEQLLPSPPADKTTLIRRLSLDLRGLPPTPSEVDAFLADDRPDAYEQLVERLFQSPHYGERMCVDWLDAARFADTNGYHIDNGRDMTRWREWVIAAFQRNLPYDQFTIDQLAGDLLPQATLDQKIASGFHRNHMTNFEGGAIPAEYHVAYIVDRVNTTGTVWLGLSVGCAQCHDHKYDPLTQKEYYQLYAFFHNVPENGLDGYNGNSQPMLRIPTSDQKRQSDEVTASVQSLESQLNGPWPEVDAAQVRWESAIASASPPEWQILSPIDFRSKGGATSAVQDDQSVVVGGTNPATDTYAIALPLTVDGVTAIRLEALPDKALNGGGPGRSVNGNIVLTNVSAVLEREGGGFESIKIKAASADFSQQNFPIAHAIDEQPQTGWAIHPEVGKPHFAVFEFDRTLKGGKKLTLNLDFLSQYGQHQLGRLRLATTTAAQPHATNSLPPQIAQIVATSPDQRNDQQRSELRSYYRSNVSGEAQQARMKLEQARQQQKTLDKLIATTMVMQELAQPRDTFVLLRGQYDKFGEKVSMSVPASLPPLPADSPRNRLGLAQWLVSPAHPLTSRVTVNRYWQMFFGTGIVKTAEDFGSQGEPPVHPALLDWLATEFMAPKTEAQFIGGWDVQALIKLIVTSATYQQSSIVSRDLVARDPENRWLARGPRHRLQVEFIRDQALAVSGLLDRRIGGRSVSPYQPPGLWEELMSRADGDNWTAQKYLQDHGPDLYRRTMYTFWKRTCPPPSLATFDAPDRETCTVRRARTNTPLQALVLLNDPTYVEASRKLAERALVESGPSTDDRLEFLFRQVLARKPQPRELQILHNVLAGQLESFHTNSAGAAKLLKIGESSANESIPPAELAAWSMVSSVLLNLDESVTKN